MYTLIRESGGLRSPLLQPLGNCVVGRDAGGGMSATMIVSRRLAGTRLFALSQVSRLLML